MKLKKRSALPCNNAGTLPSPLWGLNNWLLCGSENFSPGSLNGFEGVIPMKTESLRLALWRLLKKFMLVFSAICIITALICWLGGWHGLYNFGMGLMISGLCAFLLGGVTAFGGTQIARDPTYRYIQSVMPNSLSDRTRQDWTDLLDSFSFFLMMVSSGLVSMVVGWLVTLSSR
jgi:hypothetical protein